MAQPVAIITGGSSGIGLNAAKKLVSKGIFCIIASRNVKNLNAAVQRIKDETGRDNVEGVPLDLCDFQSIRNFVNDFNARNLPLNILVNNAGLINLSKVLTKDGLEQTFVANHLGHFLLTNLLLDKLKASAPSRIVVVASSMEDSTVGRNPTPELAPIESFNFENTPYDSSVAYRISKRANVLFTFYLNRMLKGTGVIVNTMCPGAIPDTQLSRSYPRVLIWLARSFRRFIFGDGVRTLDHGGDCVVDLAIGTKPEILEGGHFFFDMEPTETSAGSRDENEQRKLWELSEKLVGLKSE